MSDPNISFFEKVIKKNEISVKLLNNAFHKSFNPSLQFISQKCEPNAQHLSEEQKMHLIKICPNNFGNDEKTREFLIAFYKLERKIILQSIKDSHTPWRPSFLDGIDYDIFHDL